MAVLDKFQTKKSSAREVSPRMYKDPGTNYLDYDKIPEGTTFTAPSLAPKEYLLDQNAILPTDRNPIDWQMVSETGGADISTEERNQRAYVRDYLAQKYAQAADTKGVEDALAKQKYENQWADAGHNVDRMLMAHSAARGGPGADAAYWQGQKKAAAGAVDEQEGLRQAKIKDYLMKQKMGSEGVDELQQMHGYDITNAQNDPTSDISRSYQNAFGAMFPKEAADMKGDIPNMSAVEIGGIAKMYGAKAESELRQKAALQESDYRNLMLQNRQKELSNEAAEMPLKKQRLQADVSKAQDEADRRMPGTKVSVNSVDRFRKMFPKYADMVDENTTANDIEDIIKNVTQRELAADKAREKEEKDILERDIDGVGMARTKQEAVDIRKNQTTAKNVIGSIDKIISIKKEGPVVPMSKRAREIETEQQFIMGQLRIPLQGPGAMTDSDRKQLQDTIGDATSIFSSNDNTYAKLNAIKANIENSLENAYSSSVPGYKSKKKIGIPNVGDVVGGYEFLGGDPADPKNWKGKTK